MKEWQRASVQKLTQNPGVRKIRYPLKSSLWIISSYRRQKIVKSNTNESPSLSSRKDEIRSLPSKEQKTLQSIKVVLWNWKKIHASKEDCNTDVSQLQHRGVGAYCLNFSSDMILFLIARAFDRGTAARFLEIRNGDTNCLDLFLKRYPRCLNMLFWNPSKS